MPGCSGRWSDDILYRRKVGSGERDFCGFIGLWEWDEWDSGEWAVEFRERESFAGEDVSPPSKIIILGADDEQVERASGV